MWDEIVFSVELLFLHYKVPKEIMLPKKAAGVFF